MAFWGVEVRPGRPYAHRYDSSHGRLHITQATLASCDAATRTVVQCIVGNNTPVLICSLNPKFAEMCHLDIELEEDDDVLFSVLGQSSVHLSGYYLSASRRGYAGDNELESEGEDVADSHTDEEDNASDDTFESDFIDDRDAAVYGDEYVSDSFDSGDVPDHQSQQAFEKNTGKVEPRRRLEKKHQVSEENDDAPYNNDDSPYKPAAKRIPNSIFDSGSEDEDDSHISVSLTKKNSVKVSEEIKPENVQLTDETREKSNDARKRKSDAINQDTASPMDVTEVNGSSTSKQEAEIKNESKKKKKTPLAEEDGKYPNNVATLEDGLIIEDLSLGDQDAKVASDGNKVYINYVGKLQDGETIHSNAGEKPYKFKLGAGKVIRGWDVGICGMRVGGKRRLTIPPSMWDGDKTVGGVAKDSTIIYQVELVKVW